MKADNMISVGLNFHAISRNSITQKRPRKKMTFFFASELPTSNTDWKIILLSRKLTSRHTNHGSWTIIITFANNAYYPDGPACGKEDGPLGAKSIVIFANNTGDLDETASC